MISNCHKIKYFNTNLSVSISQLVDAAATTRIRTPKPKKTPAPFYQDLSKYYQQHYLPNRVGYIPINTQTLSLKPYNA